MKQDLETVRLELEDYLEKKPFVLFRGFSRVLAEMPNAIEWDSYNFPDFKAFLAVAEKLNVSVINLHTSRLTEEEIDGALEQLEEADVPFDERRDVERRLKELRMYAGFTGEIEISFDYQGNSYFFSRTTDWYGEANALIEEIDASLMSDALGGDDEEPYGGSGGYFSRN